ncbi:MAG TPA: FAD-binding oxidoreductase [Candidatus Limnocylindria bacterium]
MSPSATADIVIIGGGIVGTSIAYHLARRGSGRGVVLLEQDKLGSGTTSAAGGGIRSQFSTEINIRFSLESVAAWRRFEEELGLPADYREIGYLFLAQTAEEREMFKRNVALQNRFGVPSRFIEPGEAATLVPGLRVDDLTGATYSAEDAVAGPNEATQAYARRARDAGVEVREGVTVTGITTSSGRVRGVETSSGPIAAGMVVNAAGPWAGQVGKLAGIEVPVTPYRRTTFVSEPFDGLPATFPLILDLHVGWACRREGQSIQMSGRRDQHSSFDRHVDWDGLARSAELAQHRLPALAGARFGKRASAGLYDVSPDNHAIMGQAPDLEGFYLACGFSGHGFQHGPATGRLMAELLLDGRTTGIDIAPLAIERFRTGSTLAEPMQLHVRGAA